MPTGDEFSSADFEVFIAFKQSDPTFSLDLHAIALNTTGLTLASDYDAPGTSIQAGLLNSATSYDFQDIYTDATGDANLVDYLNANYWTASSGGTQDVFVTLRLRMDADGTAYSGYALASDVTWGQPAVLSFTTAPIPEPASITLLGLGGLMMLRRRQR